jgi:hypothetical protein
MSTLTVAEILLKNYFSILKNKVNIKNLYFKTK